MLVAAILEKQIVEVKLFCYHALFPPLPGSRIDIYHKLLVLLPEIQTQQ